MSRPTLGDSKTERLNMFITADEISAIDEWRWQQRVASRSEAIRQLIGAGLKANSGLALIECLKDARRFLDPELIDVGYIDEVIAKAEAKPTPAIIPHVFDAEDRTSEVK